MQQAINENYAIDVINIIEEESPGYDGVTLFYILKGVTQIHNEGENKTFSAGSLFIINKNERYSVNAVSDNIVVKLSISHCYFSHYYANYAAASFTLEKEQNNTLLQTIRELFTRLAISQLQGDKETCLLDINGRLTDLLSILILHCKTDKQHDRKPERQYSIRMENTLNYLKSNYNKPLSLSLLAEINHTSLSYFSRLFTREVGINFKTYLTQLRFMKCTEALVKTKTPLYQIVEENGFSGTRNFTTLFKTHYGVTPNQYRVQHRAGESPDELLPKYQEVPQPARPARYGAINTTELLALLANHLSNNESTDFKHIPTKNLIITLPQEGKLPPALPYQSYIIRVSKLEEVLKSHVQQQIILTKQQMPLEYIQVEHILSESTIPQVAQTDEDYPSCSPYHTVDRAVEFLKQQGVGLLFSLYFQPVEGEMRSRHSRFLDFIAHSIRRFGAAWVSTWALSYHPDCRFVEEYTARFLRLRQRIKDLLPGFKMGLFYPFPIAKEALTQLPFFSSDLAKKVDFIGFDANANSPINRERFQKEDFDNAERFVQQHSLNIIAQLKKHGVTAPLFLQAWNTLTGNTRHTNGCFFRGALLMDTLNSLPEQVTSLGFWINSEIQCEILADKCIDISSLALFYVCNTRRPVFHILSMRERLQGKVLAKSQHILITATPQGYRVLLTNSVTFNPCLAVQQQLLDGFRKQINLAITGIEPGTYQIKKHLFDQQHGSLYRQFECQPTRYGRDEEVMQFIDQHAAPALHIYDEKIGNCWEACVEMDVNALCLFEINKIWTP